MLHAERTSTEWIDRNQYQQQLHQNSFLRKIQRPVESDNKLNNQKQAPTTDPSVKISSSDDFKIMGDDSHLDNVQISNGNDDISGPRLIYDHAIDGFSLVGNRKGFLRSNAINFQTASSSDPRNPIVGVYCIRWRRFGALSENETKMIVNCIKIVEAPLNLGCALDEKMYVKVPMTLSISLKNTTNSTIHLKSLLKNTDNFMFAGHSQVSHSTNTFFIYFSTVYNFML